MTKKTIICIPGLGASKAFFAALGQTHLARQSQLMPIDLPGFGGFWGEGVADDPIAAAADRVAREVAGIGGRDVILVGHSLGGAVAILAAVGAEERVHGVVSIEGNLVAEDCGLSRQFATAAGLIDLERIKADAMQKAADSANAGVRDWARAVGPVFAATLAKYSKELVELSDSEALLRQFRAAEYRKLYLYGEDYLGHPVLGRLQSIPMDYVAGAGHVSFIGDAPEACALAISKLL
jgi:pimeloyl-ACP methyl ester carboxylesterase